MTLNANNFSSASGSIYSRLFVLCLSSVIWMSVVRQLATAGYLLDLGSRLKLVLQNISHKVPTSYTFMCHPQLWTSYACKRLNDIILKSSSASSFFATTSLTFCSFSYSDLGHQGRKKERLFEESDMADVPSHQNRALSHKPTKNIKHHPKSTQPYAQQEQAKHRGPSSTLLSPTSKWQNPQRRNQTDRRS